MDEKWGRKNSAVRVIYACGSGFVMHDAAHTPDCTSSVTESSILQHSQKTGNSKLSFLF